MIIASLNLNKRYGSPQSRSHLQAWCETNHVDFLLVQEPWRVNSAAAHDLFEYRRLGGNDKVQVWRRSIATAPTWQLIADYCQRVDLGYFAVYSCYLDAYKQSIRAEQLRFLTGELNKQPDRPTVVVGDFNLAPHPKDGLASGSYSTFNSEVDRSPFQELLASAKLIDTGANTGDPQFTIERNVRGKSVKFRCDLALVSDYVCPSVQVSWDASVRKGRDAFTDHSAILLNLPVTWPVAPDMSGTLFPEFLADLARRSPLSSEDCEPHRTAMSRGEASPIARFVGGSLPKCRRVKTILDFGCGRGDDVRFYRSMGLIAEGFDPHEPFGWSRRPTGQFDVVTVTFVLNVLPDPWQRLQVIRDAAAYVSADGLVIVTTRSTSAIRNEATKKGWAMHHDGFWSHRGKGTFQKGIGHEEIIAIGRRCGLDQDGSLKLPSFGSASCSVALRFLTSGVTDSCVLSSGKRANYPFG